MNPASTPASSLGPGNVGVRVVVRRVVRGSTAPSGRPLLTDVLGVLESWGETTLTVRTEDGEAVVIHRADLVAGKPVPPRPSVRHRVTVEDAEQRALDVWPPIEVERLGDWLLRAAGGFSRRANSALVLGSAERPWEDAVTEVERFYRDRGQRPLVQTLAGSDVAERLSAAGWQPASDLVHFQLAGLAGARRSCRELLPGDVDVDLRSDLTEIWLADDSRALTYRGPATAVLCGPQHVTFASVRDRSGVVVAKGRAALSARSDVWVGVTDLWVAPDHRREGLASVILDALLGWAAEHGASTVFLHVTDRNHEGAGLYERLGFATHHTNRYVGAP